jgi:hypothetical protein
VPAHEQGHNLITCSTWQQTLSGARHMCTGERTHGGQASCLHGGTALCMGPVHRMVAALVATGQGVHVLMHPL